MFSKASDKYNFYAEDEFESNVNKTPKHVYIEQDNTTYLTLSLVLQKLTIISTTEPFQTEVENLQQLTF